MEGQPCMHDASTVFLVRYRDDALHGTRVRVSIISYHPRLMIWWISKQKPKKKAKQSREHYCTSPRRAS